MARAVIRFGGLFALAAFIAVLVASGLWKHLSPADLRAHYAEIADFVRRHPALAPIAFAVVSAAVAAACLPAVGILIVLGGALFGTLEGGAATLLGIVLGSTLVFLACRSAASRWAPPAKEGAVGRIMATLSRHAFSTLLVLRLTPVAPLSVVNIAAGLARIRLAPFVAASLLGSAPSNFVYAGLGAGLKGAFAHGLTLNPAMLANPTLIWPLVALAALAGAAAIVNLRRRG